MEEFETERLQLRIYTDNDREYFIGLMTDRDVMEKVGDGVLSIDAAEKLWAKLFTELYSIQKKTIWAVFAKDDGRYVGHAWIRPRPQHPEDWEIGYILGKCYWGNGLATEIACSLIDLGFRVLNLPEIFSTIDDDHFASISVAKKAGMHFKRFEFDRQGRFSVYSINRNATINAEDPA